MKKVGIVCCACVLCVLPYSSRGSERIDKVIDSSIAGQTAGLRELEILMALEPGEKESLYLEGRIIAETNEVSRNLMIYILTQIGNRDSSTAMARLMTNVANTAWSLRSRNAMLYQGYDNSTIRQLALKRLVLAGDTSPVLTGILPVARASALEATDIQATSMRDMLGDLVGQTNAEVRMAVWRTVDLLASKVQTGSSFALDTITKASVKRDSWRLDLCTYQTADFWQLLLYWKGSSSAYTFNLYPREGKDVLKSIQEAISRTSERNLKIGGAEWSVTESNKLPAPSTNAPSAVPPK